MYKYEVGIIGYFAKGKSKAGGQEAKTCAIAKELGMSISKSNILEIDTLNWKKHPFRLLFDLIKLGTSCKNVIMLPAQNSLPIFSCILTSLKKVTKCRIHYAVVGGWLASKTRNKSILTHWLKCIDYIYVETSSMKRDLELEGFSNIILFPNFKHIRSLSENELVYNTNFPIHLCFFSRVIREKGVEDIVNAVNQLNKDNVIFDLDIYGPIQPGEEEWFTNLSKKFSKDIKYKGFVEPDQSVSILKNYTALVFPTHYKTEGIPGTIIDAYSAGVPVITSLWNNSGDVFEENYTGWGYEIGSYEGLLNCLRKLEKKLDTFNSFKVNCLEKAKEYRPSEIMKIMLARIKD